MSDNDTPTAVEVLQSLDAMPTIEGIPFDAVFGPLYDALIPSERSRDTTQPDS